MFRLIYAGSLFMTRGAAAGVTRPTNHGTIVAGSWFSPLLSVETRANTRYSPPTLALFLTGWIVYAARRMLVRGCPDRSAKIESEGPGEHARRVLCSYEYTAGINGGWTRKTRRRSDVGEFMRGHDDHGSRDRDHRHFGETVNFRWIFPWVDWVIVGHLG